MDRRTLLEIAHDVSLAVWFGGAWMGAVALNSATIEVDDHTQRMRVANAGWFAWAPVTGAAIVVHVGSAALLGRVVPAFWRSGVAPSTRWRCLVTLAALAAAVETGGSGRRVMMAGDVPVATAVVPISDTPDEVARAQRRLRVGQWTVPVVTGALWVLDAVQRSRA
jgi:hypothetical protein